MGTTSLNISLVEPLVHTISLVAPVAMGATKVSIDTTSNWESKIQYIPKRGEIVIFEDRTVINEINYPGIKIGDGLAYAVDLPFLGDDISNEILTVINEHMNNTGIHVSAEEKEYWNNKLDCEIIDENLVLSPA